MQNQKNKLNDIREQVFGKKKPYDPIDIWHYLMIHYGWIPFEDFKDSNAFLVDELVTRLNKMNEKGSKKPKGLKGW